MRFPNAKNWAEWGLENGPQRLFFLLWEEMFDPDTPDTWQVRTTSVRAGLSEIVEAVEVAQQHDPYRHNLPHIIDETMLTARRDPVIERYFRFVGDYLKPFSGGDSKHLDLSALHKTAKVLLAETRTYPEFAGRLLREVLLKKDHEKEKDLLNRLAMGLATELACSGYAHGHLASLSSLLADGSTPFAKRIEEFLGHCSGRTSDYECILPLPDDLRPFTRTLKLANGKFIKHAELPRGLGRKIAPPENPEQVAYALITVTALDSYSARQVARAELEALCSACNLFRFRGVFRLRHDEALVGRRGEELRKLLPDPLDALSMKDTVNAVVAAGRTLEQFLGRGDDDSELAAALQHHKVGLLAPTHESKFLNFWIALECLVRGEDGNVIDRVCTSIPPCLAVRNLLKQVRSAAIYLRQYWYGHEQQQEIMSFFPSSGVKHLDPVDMLNFMLLPKDADAVKKLYGLCADNPLLIHRIHRLRSDVFASAEKAKKNVETHLQSVSWQLRRLYRARNQITHHGHGHPQIHRLLAHLHTYLVETIHALMHELNRHKGDWSVPLALQHRRLLCDHFARALAQEECRVTKAALMDPRRALGDHDGELAWPSAVKPGAGGGGGAGGVK
jgi:hypothetical protein